MLNLAVVRSAAYYLDQVAPDPTAYYLGRGEAPGRWWGRLSGTLGLSGTVEADALRMLLEGRHPLDATPLLRARPSLASGPAVRAGAGLAGAGAFDAEDPEASAARSHADPAHPGHLAMVGVAAAADLLGVSARTVRRWATDGEALWRLAQESAPNGTLHWPGDVRARLSATLGPEAALAADRCLLVPPSAGRRRRWLIPADEVERLRRERRVPSTRLGYDVVFRAAKGWSVLWAVGPPAMRQALAEVHREAVSDALAYLEATSAVTRATVAWRGGPVRVRARGEGLVVARFDHRESRAADPLLHTHCLVANVTRLPGGRFGALESSALFRQQRAADAVYQATFRHLAAVRLGIRSLDGPAVFPEPDGVPAEVIAHFSKRSDEIAEEVERHGSASAAARQLAALATRRAKEVAGREEDLHGRWRREAAELGFTEADAAACLHRPVPAEAPWELVERILRRLAGPEGLTASAATFNRGEVVCALAAELAGRLAGPEVVALADRFLASELVVPVREHRPGRPRGRIVEAGVVVDDLTAARFTVPEVVAAEERLMAAAAERSGPLLDVADVRAVLAGHGYLSAEQAAMVREVCADGSLLRPVVGLPGSGKTTATGALVQALGAAAIPVVGCAVTATAAAELGQRAGIAACDTLARTLADLDGAAGGLPPGVVVIADEASMLGHRHLVRLVDHVRAAGGALVLIGDPHQHAAVGPGSFFSWLLTEREAVSTLETNLRQRDVVDDQGAVVASLAPERRASLLFRVGDVGASLQARDEAGLVSRAPTPRDLQEQMVADWWADEPGARDPMVASSNDARERLNRTARARLRQAGVLTGPALVVGDREFQAGDSVVARRNDRRLRSPADNRWWVRNGAWGTVIEVHPAQGTVTVDFSDSDGAAHRVLLPATYVAEHLEHSYALTDYGVQGRTLTRSRALLDDAAGAPGTYVATTRGRIENRVYVVEGETAATEGVDVGHGSPGRRRSGLDLMAARIAGRRPDPMVHQRDPYVAAAARLAERCSTDELRRQADALDRILAGRPTDPTAALQSAEQARNAFAAKGSADPETARRLAKLDASIATLEQRQAEWAEWNRHLPERRRRRQAIDAALLAQENRRRLAPDLAHGTGEDCR